MRKHTNISNLNAIYAAIEGITVSIRLFANVFYGKVCPPVYIAV